MQTFYKLFTILIYDFSRSIVSLVQLQKGFNPDISVKTKPLTQ